MKQTWLELANMQETTLELNGEEHSVEGCSAGTFDAWVRKLAQAICNVDTITWDVFERWRIINFLLLLDMLELKDKRIKLPPAPGPEEQQTQLMYSVGKEDNS